LVLWVEVYTSQVPEGKRPPFDSHYLIVNSTTLSPTFVEGSLDFLTHPTSLSSVNVAWCLTLHYLDCRTNREQFPSIGDAKV